MVLRLNTPRAPSTAIRSVRSSLSGEDTNATIGEKAGGAAGPPNEPARSTKVPRNAPCPCGSGKKYKHCHGKIA
ncbi:MAG: SEC-C metal-binding domain-containing protein [Parvularculales bacterium]